VHEESEHLEKAQMIIQQVAKMTQQELEYHIAELVSLALSSVFPDPYELHLDFVTRRNRTEADISFTSSNSGEKIHPATGTGGGAVDVAAFALRISGWHLKRPRSRNTMIFDEPFRFLSKDLQSKASDMLKEISEKLNLQMIIVTHEESLAFAATRRIKVSKRGRISSTEVENPL
jgi:DNA repair exonuclease SbcCD ATPase subunit